MCGIAGIYRFTERDLPMRKMMGKLLLGIEQRGKDATGVASVSFGNGMLVEKDPVTATEFLKRRLPLEDSARTMLGHTRLATQGRPEHNVNNHPVVHGKAVVTHNGMISNDFDLFRKYDIKQLGFVDTEIIPALIDKYGWANAKTALEEVRGTMAIAAIHVDHPNELLLAKGNSSPLVFIRTKDFVVWASTKNAIKDMWGDCLGTPPADDRFIEMKQGDMMVVSPEGTTESKFTPASGYTYNYGGSSRGTSAYNSYGSYDSAWYDGYDDDEDYVVGTRGRPNVSARTYQRKMLLKMEREELATYVEWASEENKIAGIALHRAAEKHEISVEMAEWLLFVGDASIISEVDTLLTAYVVISKEFEHQQNKIIGELAKAAREKAAAKKDKTKDKHESPIAVLTGAVEKAVTEIEAADEPETKKALKKALKLLPGGKEAKGAKSAK